MPQSKFQEVVFTVFMAAVMVYGMVCYNIPLNLGGLSDAVFGRVFGEWPIMTVAAIALELVFVGRLSKKVAFCLVKPDKDGPTATMLAISAASVWMMCPCMSLIATLLFKNGPQTELFSTWVQTTVLNFPMALCWQLFAAGPLVRRVFGVIFGRK